MKRFLTILVIAFLPACAQLGLAPAQSFGERLAYAYTINASARNSAANALDAKRIGVSDAKHVLDTTNTVRAALDEAAKIGCPKAPPSADPTKPQNCLDGSAIPATAIGKLEFGLSIAQSAQSFLTTLGVK